MTMFAMIAQARKQSAVSLALAQGRNRLSDRQLDELHAGNWTWAGGYRPSVSALVRSHRVGVGGWR
jgi:hypothetical protein